MYRNAVSLNSLVSTVRPQLNHLTLKI